MVDRDRTCPIRESVVSPSLDPSLVILDLDGTVVDSSSAMAHCIRAGCAAVGVSVHPGDDLAWTNGPKVEESLRTLVGAERMAEARAAYRAEYLAAGPRLTRLVPGARAFLDRMVVFEKRLAIATYRPLELADPVLRSTGIREYFDPIVARRLDSDERPKALLLLDVLAITQVLPANALFIGDHEEDRRGAEEVGIAFIQYLPGAWEGIRCLLTNRRLITQGCIGSGDRETPNNLSVNG